MIEIINGWWVEVEERATHTFVLCDLLVRLGSRERLTGREHELNDAGLADAHIRASSRALDAAREAALPASARGRRASRLRTERCIRRDRSYKSQLQSAVTEVLRRDNKILASQDQAVRHGPARWYRRTSSGPVAEHREHALEPSHRKSRLVIGMQTSDIRLQRVGERRARSLCQVRARGEGELDGGRSRRLSMSSARAICASTRFLCRTDRQAYAEEPA